MIQKRVCQDLLRNFTYYNIYLFQAPNFVPREYLKSWQERHHLWLELSDVSKDVTHQIRVTVIPFYM
jgi:hypothetical protein